MRFYPPIYPGDSLLQPGNFPGDRTQKRRKIAVFPAFFVRRNTSVENAPEHRIDATVIEQQARTAGHAWVGSKLKSFYEALVRKFDDAGRSEMEDYLAASQNLADLEERIRRYERMQWRNY